MPELAGRTSVLPLELLVVTLRRPLCSPKRLEFRRPLHPCLTQGRAHERPVSSHRPLRVLRADVSTNRPLARTFLGSSGLLLCHQSFGTGSMNCSVLGNGGRGTHSGGCPGATTSQEKRSPSFDKAIKDGPVTLKSVIFRMIVKVSIRRSYHLQQLDFRACGQLAAGCRPASR